MQGTLSADRSQLHQTCMGKHHALCYVNESLCVHGGHTVYRQLFSFSKL